MAALSLVVIAHGGQPDSTEPVIYAAVEVPICLPVVAAPVVSLPRESARKPLPQRVMIDDGRASWYGQDDQGGTYVAAGGRYNENALTAAHRYWAFGRKVRVKHGNNEVVVTINDRGPYTKDRRGRYTRLLDLSKKAFSKLAPLGAGVIDVKVYEVK